MQSLSSRKASLESSGKLKMVMVPWTPTLLMTMSTSKASSWLTRRPKTKSGQLPTTAVGLALAVPEQRPNLGIHRA